MNVESLPLAQARAGNELLVQYLVSCPACGKPAAVHADRDAAGALVLVRFVCPESCPVSETDVLAARPMDEVPLSA